MADGPDAEVAQGVEAVASEEDGGLTVVKGNHADDVMAGNRDHVDHAIAEINLADIVGQFVIL